ncbi:MAG: aminotransferase class I/II-fold pyridoxal phosphate-dependent enzyme [Sulfurimonas sp.]|nr:aminotransferase class I/II-fold pyridoxal phosphate-dependent enzyme [Sulfurimonas sp.]
MKHGANIYKYAKKLKCKSSQIIDFSSNINLHQPKIEIKLKNKTIVKYAQSSYKNLKKIISKNYQIKTKQISLYNGATSAIHELFKFLEPKKVYLYSPLYSEYEKAQNKDTKLVKIDRIKKPYTDVEYNSTVVFVNPSTPDAKFYNLDKLFKLWIKQNCTIVLDESFLEFEDLESFRDNINTYNKLYIIQSFSKFNSCAGVRIGAIFSNKKNIKKLTPPIWNLSSFDVKFLTLRLKDKTFSKKTKSLHKKRKKELYDILNNSRYITKVYKSDSNFFLTKVKNSKKLFSKLLKKKILVRKCGSFDYLSDDYFRFSVKDSTSLKALKKILND